MKMRHFSIPLTFSLILGGVLFSTQLATAQTEPLINNGGDDGVNMTNSDGSLFYPSQSNTVTGISNTAKQQLRDVIHEISESLQQPTPQQPESQQPESQS